MAAPTFSSPAQLLPRIPITLLMKPGELRLGGGRLRFDTGAPEPVLDVPVTELHSVSTSVTGIHVWHGSHCFRFVFPRTESYAASWLGVLAPEVGAPPQGVRVRRPWPRWAWTVGVVTTVVVIVAAVLVLSRIAQ